MESSTSDRRIKRDTGGRNKNPVAKKLRTPKFKPSERLYIKFSRKGKKVSQWVPLIVDQNITEIISNK